MPVYVYRCRDCSSNFEKRQSFSDAPLTTCESCGGRLQKVFQPTTIIYKGSGFYSTDHRSQSGGIGGNGNGAKEDASKEATKDATSKDTAAPSKDAGKASAAATGKSDE